MSDHDGMKVNANGDNNAPPSDMKSPTSTDHKILKEETIAISELSAEERHLLPVGCIVSQPTWIGDGYCDKSGNYNTAVVGKSVEEVPPLLGSGTRRDRRQRAAPGGR